MLWPTQVQSESASAACARARPLLTGVPAWWLVLLAMAGSLAQVGKLGKQGFCNALNFQGRLLGSLLPDSTYELWWRLGKDHAEPLAAGDAVVGFDLVTGEAFTPPMASGKYLRTVKVSLTAITPLDGYKLAA